MKIKQLKDAFFFGHLHKAEINPFMGKFVLVVTTVENEKISMELKTGGVRQFSSLQAAINAAAEIGFDKVTINGILTDK